MASKLPPVKNSGYTFRIVLFAQSDNQIKTTPTIAAGDFKTSLDGGTLANLGTLPAEGPAGSGIVLITLSAAEMNGDEAVVTWKDAAGDEWHSGAAIIHTVASGQQFDQLSTFDETTATVDVGKLSGDATAADNAEAFFDGTGYAGTGNTIPTVTTLTGHTVQTGDSYARLGAPAGASIAADVAALNDIAVADILTTQMTEAYAADGTAPTLAQALFLIQQSIGDFAISGTTLTVKQIDGTTAAATYTLDDASDPTEPDAGHLMAVKHLISPGVGFSPGSIEYIVTRGLKATIFTVPAARTHVVAAETRTHTVEAITRTHTVEAEA